MERQGIGRGWLVVFLVVLLLVTLTACGQQEEAGLADQPPLPSPSETGFEERENPAETGEQEDVRPEAGQETEEGQQAVAAGKVASGRADVQTGGGPVTEGQGEGETRLTAEPETAETTGDKPASPAEESEETKEAEEAEEQTKQSGSPTTIKFSEMYSGGGVRGLEFSDKFKELEGQKVQMTGYMAPPLKPVFTMFVLSRVPLALCPFCSSDSDWPEDIMAVVTKESDQALPFDKPISVTGVLELGSYTHEETGFVSQARIIADKVEVIK